jgi:hypothetical protein
MAWLGVLAGLIVDIDRYDLLVSGLQTQIFDERNSNSTV